MASAAGVFEADLKAPLAAFEGFEPEDFAVRSLIGLIIVIYLVGVGVALAPVFENNWTQGTASQLSAHVVEAAPQALAWPVPLYRRLAGQVDAERHEDKTP